MQTASRHPLPPGVFTTKHWGRWPSKVVWVACSMPNNKWRTAAQQDETSNTTLSLTQLQHQCKVTTVRVHTGMLTMQCGELQVAKRTCYEWLLNPADSIMHDHAPVAYCEHCTHAIHMQSAVAGRVYCRSCMPPVLAPVHGVAAW